MNSIRSILILLGTLISLFTNNIFSDGLEENCLEKKVRLVRKVSDEKKFNPETGESQLHINFELEVREEGEYSVEASFGKARQYRFLTLTNGLQSATIIFYGDSINYAGVTNFSGQISVWTFGETGKGHLEDKLPLNLTKYNNTEFKRVVAEPDSSLSFEEIASQVGETCMLRHHRYLAKECRREVNGVNILELGLPHESRDYHLYNFRAGIRDERIIYIAISKDRKKAFPIINDEYFNDFVRTLNVSVTNVEQTTQILEFYWAIFSSRADVNILKEMPNDTKPKHDRYKSINGWFQQNPRQEFHKPKLSFDEQILSLNFYAWTGLLGVLSEGSVKMKSNGEIISLEATKLAQGLGSSFIY